MTDLDAIRARHVLYARDPTIKRTEDDPAWCAACEDPWPCDTAQVLAALDAARADADELAEALGDVMVSDHLIDTAAEYDLIEIGYYKAPWVRARAALVAHKAQEETT